MHRLQQASQLLFYLLLALLVSWFALVSWVYLAPANWLANQAQNGFIYQQLSPSQQEFIRQVRWQELTGRLGSGQAQQISLPLARLETLNWQLNFFSLLLAQPKLEISLTNTQVTSPLSLSLGATQGSLQPEQHLIYWLIHQKTAPKFNWQLSLQQPKEHQLILSGHLTPQFYSFKGEAEISSTAQVLPAMQLLRWRKTNTPTEYLPDGQSFQARGSGRF